MEKIVGDYKLVCNSIENKPGTWNSLLVEIYKNDKKLGEYKRNYHTLYDTFCPFTYKGKEYALYSKDYTATRVMSLPDCKDLGGEDSHGFGFCPVDYYVPCDEEDLEDGIDGSFGFVAGCVWGDDYSWKIQYLDLSDIENGNIKREDRFGYVELARNQSLKDAIDLECFSREFDEPTVFINNQEMYNLDTGETTGLWWYKKMLKKLLVHAKNGTLEDVKNPYYKADSKWIYDVVMEVFGDNDESV